MVKYGFHTSTSISHSNLSMDIRYCLRLDRTMGEIRHFSVAMQYYITILGNMKCGSFIPTCIHALPFQLIEQKKTVIIYLVCIHTVIHFNHFLVDATSLRLIQGSRKVCKQPHALL